MTLPASGAISFNNINVELGVAGTTQASLGQASYRTLAGVASGAISMSNFWGKSNAFSFTISANQTNANLRTLAINAGWNQSSALYATVNSGVYISSNSTGTPALTVSGSFPGGVTLTNNGVIVGMGGAGGAGAGLCGTTAYDGSAGSAGGLALSVSSAITIANNGTIAGGGGGGGGGQNDLYIDTAAYGSPIYYLGGGGGGGGMSSAAANSSGGGGSYSCTANNGAGGGVGTSASAGGGGAAGGFSSYRGGVGGGGGSWGAAGGSGGYGTSPYTPTASRGPYGGGSGGGAVSGNGYISWAATGTRYGSIS